MLFKKPTLWRNICTWLRFAGSLQMKRPKNVYYGLNMLPYCILVIIIIGGHLKSFFFNCLFWDNYRFIYGCKIIQKDPMFSNGNIVQIYSIISQPGYWHWYSQGTEHSHHYKETSCCPCIAHCPPPTSNPSLNPGNRESVFHFFCHFKNVI